jgi:hypothetical protein
MERTENWTFIDVKHANFSFRRKCCDEIIASGRDVSKAVRERNRDLLELRVELAFKASLRRRDNMPIQGRKSIAAHQV